MNRSCSIREIRAIRGRSFVVARSNHELHEFHELKHERGD